MGANTFGHHFQVHTFGESHGPALGCVIEGCPSLVSFDLEFLREQLRRRRPGHHGQTQGENVSQRNESDDPEVLSGIFEGRTLGTPIAILVRNQDARSQDYKDIEVKPRSGHADDVWQKKFGHRDHRGGGRSSGRETVARVMAGAVAQMVLRQLHSQIRIIGFATQIGPEKLTDQEKKDFLETARSSKDLHPQDRFHSRFPSSRDQKIRELLKKAQEDGESYGAEAEIRVLNMIPNLGQPVFRKLKADLAAAFLSVGAVSSFHLGEGDAISQPGTVFHENNSTAQYGGIRGGISTGEDLILRVGLKPTSSIRDVAKKGRHDPCIVTRAIPVLESMVALVLTDHLLLQRLDRV